MNKNLLRIGAIAVIAIVALGGWYWNHARNAPEAILHRYMNAVQQQKLQDAYQLLTERNKVYLSYADFEATSRLLAGTRVETITRISTSTYRHVYEYEIVNLDKRTKAQVSLVHEPAGWRVVHLWTLWAKVQTAKKQNYEERTGILKSILEIAPWEIEAEYAIADNYINRCADDVRNQEACREAVEITRTLSRDHPNVRKPFQMLGVAYVNVGLHKDAIAAFSRGYDLADTPQTKAWSLLARARVKFDLNDLKGGQEDLKNAEALDPDNVEIKQARAKLERYKPFTIR